jgi:hypothetical protein
VGSEKGGLLDHFGDLNLVARALRCIGQRLLLCEARA